MANSRKWREPPARPTPAEFIKAWQTSSSVAQVASKLRMKKDQVRVRACRYRQKGVRLKKYVPAEIPVWDWGKLAAYAESFEAQGSAGAADSDEDSLKDIRSEQFAKTIGEVNVAARVAKQGDGQPAKAEGTKAEVDLTRPRCPRCMRLMSPGYSRPSCVDCAALRASPVAQDAVGASESPREASQP